MENVRVPLNIWKKPHLDVEGSLSVSTEGLPAKDAYRLGYDAVMKKVSETQNKYCELMKFFDLQTSKEEWEL